MSGDPNNTRIFDITTGDAIVDGMSARVAWGPTTITYAFPDAGADYDPTNYNILSPYDEPNNFAAFNAAQKAVSLAALSNIAGFTNVGFTLGSDATANIRMANSGAGGTMLGWMYHAFPNEITGGDVWISNTQAGYSTPQAGNAAHLVQMHEIAHSMGLDHPWATTHGTATIYDTLGLKYDGFEYTVMSYRGYTRQVGSNIEYGSWNEVGANSFAQTYMMNDIYTLQYMYGADYTTNSGNTTYAWDGVSGDTLVNGSVWVDGAGSKIFATIWDGGGIDTYDLSAYTTGVTVDLSPGKSSAFDDSQLANLGDGRKAAGNIYNALLFGGNTASMIENAIGGSGADTLDGNSISNTLTGNGGIDILYGKAGNDTLYGNGGTDTYMRVSADRTELDVGGSPGKTHNVRVRGVQTTGEKGEWSQGVSITVPKKDKRAEE